MAATTLKSPQVLRHLGTLGGVNDVKFATTVVALSFDFTQVAAGDAGSTMDLIYVPAGTQRLYGIALFWSAFGSSRVLDLGHTAYVGLDGVTVAADLVKFFENKDVSALGRDFFFVDSLKFQSRDGVLLQANVAGGTIPDAAKLTGFILVG